MSDVVERFMRYVQVDSQSDPRNEEQTPSTPGQHDMARLLGEELRALGCEDVVVDEHAYVTASVPASKGCEQAPALGLCAHIDSAPDAPGFGVKPHLVHYEGGDLVVGVVDGRPVSVSPDLVPDLAQFVGQDIVCSDGTTLLSADDKAGVAEIMDAVQYIVNHPEFKHGPVCIGFTPDEEIGRGVVKFDVARFGADYAYTMPAVSLTTEESDIYTSTYNDINTYVSETVLLFINGDKPLDEFDEFVENIRNLGIQDCLDCQQAAYDRYLKR